MNIGHLVDLAGRRWLIPTTLSTPS